MRLADNSVLDELKALAGRHDRSAWQRAAELIGRSGRYRWVGLYQVTETEIRAVAWTGSIPPQFPVFSREAGLNGVAVRTKAPVVSQDVANDPRYLTTFSNTGSEAVIPVISDAGHVLGTIDVESERRNAFSVDDELFLAACAASLRPLWESARRQPLPTVGDA
jgi:putative methionine-R-sulfoxide reductase with GAF domain